MSQSLAFQSGSLQTLNKGSFRCCRSIRQTTFKMHRSVNRQRTQRRSTLIRAKEDPEEKGQKIDNRKIEEQTNKLVEGMKKGGIDSSTAQRILDTWEKTGATSTDALRKMLLGRSLKTVGVVLFQLLLDAGAAYGSYNSGRQVHRLCSLWPAAADLVFCNCGHAAVASPTLVDVAGILDRSSSWAR